MRMATRAQTCLLELLSLHEQAARRLPQLEELPHDLRRDPVTVSRFERNPTAIPMDISRRRLPCGYASAVLAAMDMHARMQVADNAYIRNRQCMQDRTRERSARAWGGAAREGRTSSSCRTEDARDRFSREDGSSSLRSLPLLEAPCG